MVEYLRILLGARFATRDERGASAVEYGLLVGGIAALVVVVVFALGDNIQALFDDACDTVQSKANSTAC